MRWVAVGLALVIAGCTTGAQRRAEEIRAINNKSALDQKACVQEVNDDPVYAPLKSELIPPGMWSLEQLSNPNFITDLQKPIYIAYRQAMRRCDQIALDSTGQYDLIINSILQRRLHTSDALRVKFLQGQLTWGQLRSALVDVQSASRDEIVSREQALNANLQLQNQQELDRRAAIAQQTQENYLRQQAINRANQPVITNCSRVFGGGTQCVTQ